MEKMTTTKGGEIYIDLCSIKAMSPGTRTINAHRTKREQTEEGFTSIDLGGEGNYHINEPSFTELLRMTNDAQRNR